ncbi:MAG: class I SAM-dependent methyltransferase [Spirochaetaceae bacterium]
METIPFEHYLEAKRVVDDRSLNQRVWGCFKDALGVGPRRILEVGAGTGTMLHRLRDWGLAGPLDYTGIEPNPELLSPARRRVPPGDWRVTFRDDTLDTVTGSFDAVLANAVLDILPAAESLSKIGTLLEPGGLFYATITFDGLTVFHSPEPVEADQDVIRAYHLAMDSRMITGEGHGGAEAGRRILSALPEAGFGLLAAGSSDWVIAPGVEGYLPEERVLVSWLLGTIHRAVTAVLGDPRLEDEIRRRGIGLSSAGLERWIAAREHQLARDRLVVIAHQVDFCSQKIS